MSKAQSHPTAASHPSSHSPVKPSRTFDFVYDPIFTLPSAVDRAKLINHAQQLRFDVLPNFPNMFATGRNYQTFHLQAKMDTLPKAAHETAQIMHTNHVQVGGADRWKFFRRPLVPYLSNFIYMKREQLRNKEQGAQEKVRAESPLIKSVAVQTLYRESEAQTDPYSPDYVLPSNERQPDILALATLTYGQGLPVGPTELEMIERARAKRQWEASLPPITDAESFEKRLKMMEQMELKEWAYREAEIKRLQDARLDILKNVIQKRESEIEQINSARMEKIWQKKLQEREVLKEKIQRKKAKILRNLVQKRRNPENRLQRRDIIAEYADFGSKVYAPKIRDGVVSECLGESLPPSNKLLNNLDYDAALNFSQRPLDYVPRGKKQSYSITARKEEHVQNQLRIINERLQAQKVAQSEDEKNRPLRFLVKVEKPIQRPETPSIPQPDLYNEAKDCAAIYLQRLLRGRSAQLKMYQGKERRMTLIQELRARKVLDESTSPGSVSSVLSPEHSQNTNLKSLEFMFESNIQADFVGQALDFLSKEIVRMREERRICAMVKLAERTRRMREAEELGRRQKEMELRKQEDTVFAQLMDIHQQTVDSYLEDIIIESLSLTSSQKARADVREMSEKLGGILNPNDAQNAAQDANESPEAIVNSLMSTFLVPEVERATLRDHVTQSQRKYLKAAHDAVYDVMPKLE